LLTVLYLVPNAADAAVARRVSMLRQGGARVVLAGFRRAGTEWPKLDVIDYIELGETFDANFRQRIGAVLRAAVGLRARFHGVAEPDLIIARNLEMLALADRLLGAWADRPAIGYECLDIHRLMLRGDAVGRAMRATERYFARKASFLITSSPAFSREYFAAYRQSALPTVLLENKVLGASARATNPALAGNTQPLRIGWYGALRCGKSLAALADFANVMKGAVEIELRGRPAHTEFNDFDGFVAAQRHLHFAGPYRNPDDLPAVYGGVHFAWAIDFFEEGQNSSWLLPNRLYEGPLHGAIPIAVEGTETAAFLKRHGIGVVLPDIRRQTLVEMIGNMQPETVTALAAAVAAKDERLFAFSDDDCRDLVERLAGFATRAPAGAKTFEALA